MEPKRSEVTLQCIGWYSISHSMHFNSTTIIDWCCVILPFTVKVAWLLLRPFLPSVWSHIVMANAPTALFAIFGSSSHCFFFSMNTSLDSRQYGSALSSFAQVPILTQATGSWLCENRNLATWEKGLGCAVIWEERGTHQSKSGARFLPPFKEAQ